MDPFKAREATKYKHPIPSREFILGCLKAHGKPATEKHLLKVLHLKERCEKKALQSRLKAMIRDGQVIKNRRDSYASVAQMSLIKGSIDAKKDGLGFLIPEDNSEDIFLPISEMRRVRNNDKVLVAVTGFNLRRKKREGQIVEILEHNTQPIIGRFFKEKNFTFVEPNDKSFFRNILIPKNQTLNAKSGQYVLVEITSFPTFNRQTIGKIIQIFGNEITPGLEINLAIYTYGLPHTWPKSVLKEAKKYRLPQHSLAGRKNLTKLNFVTIDGEDAKDFDDAVFCESTIHGWKLYVAIADVSFYVKHNSLLDQEAFKRGNSVYFPNTVIPMLPEALSNELCSLKPNEDRLALVCEMNVTKEGKISSYKFYEAIICSKERLTYIHVQKILDGKQHVLSKELLMFNKLYKKLLHQRQLRGAIDFDKIETKIIFNQKGKISKIVPTERNDAHRMIEEAMLAANTCAALYLEKSKIPFLYRVHEDPSIEKIKALKNFLKPFGLRLSGKNKPTTMEYAKLLARIENRPDKHLLQIVLLRSLSQAYYAPENKGHFGLAYDSYTHFTSPIRRYPDLMTHRAIKYVLQKKTKQKFIYNFKKIQGIGQHCSITERQADIATRDATDWLKCYYMKNKVGQRFEGVISSVKNFGVFVELKDIYIEGLVHITSLKNDYYDYDETHHLLRGKRRGKVYRLSDKIKVLVARVDLDEQKIDLDLA